MPIREKWKARMLSAARLAKQGALATAKHADALMKAARQEAGTVARRRKLRQTLSVAGRALKAAGKAALAAGAAAAVAAIAESRSRKKRRKQIRRG
jgi:mevalonate pyrophosphate decarboxylase